MEKIKIQKNTVQETLVIPLAGRLVAAKAYPELFEGENPTYVIDRVDYDFESLTKDMGGAAALFGALEVVQREYDVCCEIKDYLKKYPKAAVVNMGAGLLDLFQRVDNGTCKCYNLDLPDVIDVRNEILPVDDREENIACDLNNFEWMDKIDATEGVIFAATGVFYYFTREQMEKLIPAMAEKFPGGVMTFDSANKIALKAMLKTWIKTADIQDVGAYFHVDDVQKDIAPMSDKLICSQKGYMTGYRVLDRKHYGTLNYVLTKVGDSVTSMKIVRIEFKK